MLGGCVVVDIVVVNNKKRLLMMKKYVNTWFVCDKCHYLILSGAFPPSKLFKKAHTTVTKYERGTIL